MSFSGRPEAGELAEYAKADIDFVTGDDAVAALRTQRETFLTFLTRIDERAARGLTYAPGKWTLKEVAGHMIDDERIFAYRMLCVARCDAKPLPGFDENDYVAATSFESRSLATIAAEYRVVRDATIALLDPLSDEEWRRRGVVNGYEASVRGLAFHIAGHELHHLRTLRERYLA